MVLVLVFGFDGSFWVRQRVCGILFRDMVWSCGVDLMLVI